MKFRLLLPIFILIAISSNAQKDTSSLYYNVTSGIVSIDTTSSLYALKDSCWSEPHIDTIQVDFVIIVDENNFVKKQRVDYIIDKYEDKRCKYSIYGIYPIQKQNEVFLINGKQAEVLLYRRKDNLPGSLNVGNSR